ncbi:MAG TPA: MBL fold metallo-hydrolase [Solirubrobacteraceae bacterium]|nr:MBL fold metallo-hydrolase [Solirubrobacteraceae bacterium]
MDARIIDLRYDGRPGTVGAWLCGEVLVDCGPGSCLAQLLEGLGDHQPRALMLTHVHLDHAGAAGALVARWPDLPVYVHPLGMPHLADPSRLVASARRVFGERLDELLGEVLPVPQQNLHAIDDGADVGALRCAWTPGHASHHVAFLEREDGLAFCGDVAGVRLQGDVIVPPTPPPEIDLDAWRSSLGRVAGWRPRALALAHYGLVDGPSEHLAAMDEALTRHERWAQDGEQAFLASMESYLRERLPGPAVEDYMFVALAGPSAAGLRRWLEHRPTEPSGTGAGSR